MTNVLYALVLTGLLFLLTTKRNKTKDNRSWLKFFKSATFLYLVFFICLISDASYLAYYIIVMVTGTVFIKETDERSQSLKDSLHGTFIAPVVEEVLFRLSLIFIASHHPNLLVPVGTTMCILFAIGHWYYKSYAIITMLLCKSAMYTILALQFGILTSIALHMLQNSNCIIKHLRGGIFSVKKHMARKKFLNPGEEWFLIKIILAFNCFCWFVCWILGGNPVIFFVTGAVIYFGLIIIPPYPGKQVTNQ